MGHGRKEVGQSARAIFQESNKAWLAGETSALVGTVKGVMFSFLLIACRYWQCTMAIKQAAGMDGFPDKWYKLSWPEGKK